MEKLLFRMDKKDYKENGSVFHRTAVRALIKKGDRYALIHSSKYGEYKFPGGGMKPGESRMDTLCREVTEETGLVVKLESVSYLGCVEEIRKGFTEDILQMVSYYYICEVEPEKTARNLDDYEKEYGYELEYVTLEDAVKNNEALEDTEQIPWVHRDTRVMKMIQ